MRLPLIRPHATPFMLMIAPLVVASLLGGCQTGSDSAADDSSITLDFDFSKSSIGWTGGSSDYTADTAPVSVNIESATAPTPFSGQTYLMTGVNRSDDLFLFAQKSFGGLRANQSYQAEFTVQFLTNTPSGCFGVGGAPGEAVTVKAGISPNPPKAVIDNTGYYAMNIDKGDQTQSGSQAQALGNIANGRECDGSSVYVSKTLRSSAPLTFTTNADGMAWLMIGLDSGFEAGSTVYYQRVMVSLKPQ